MCQGAGGGSRGRRCAGGTRVPCGDVDRRARRAETRARLLQAHARVYARCGATSASDAGIESPPHATEHVADVMIALGVGLPMLRQLDPDAVPASLLGAVLSVLIRAMESMPDARELLADPDSSRAASAS